MFRLCLCSTLIAGTGIPRTRFPSTGDFTDIFFPRFNIHATVRIMMVRIAIARNAPPRRSGEALWAARISASRFRWTSQGRLKPFGRRDRGARQADGKQSCPEMAPQGLEKIESAPGNGMASEASKPQDMVQGRPAHRALRLALRGQPGREVGRLAPRSRDGVDEMDQTGTQSSAVFLFMGCGNFPGCKPLKNQKTEQESRLPRLLWNAIPPEPQCRSR